MTRTAGPPRRRVQTPLFIQVFGMILLSLAFAQVVNLAILYLAPAPPPEVFRLSEVETALRVPGGVVIARSGRTLRPLLDTAPTTDRHERNVAIADLLRRNLGARLRRPLEAVRVTLLDGVYMPSRRSLGGFRLQIAPESVNPAAEYFLTAPFEAGVRQADGRWLILRVLDRAVFFSWQARVLLWFAVTALILAPVAYVFARRAAAPIASFAAAAERLGRDPQAPSLTLTGSREIETAAAAFNDMQARLNGYVRDHTGMMAAIAHDLRTPLTRLRFRVEGVPDPVRRSMTMDIEQMEAMIATTLTFMRDTSHKPTRKRLELRAVLEAVASEFADTGSNVVAETGDAVMIEGDALALSRMFANLFDNAVKFGGRARATLSCEAGDAVVEVVDEGPGIPSTLHEQIFEPFRRLEPSRSRDTGGAGLGLAVVRSIARAHGGDATVENRPSGGLLARVRLPLAASQGSRLESDLTRPTPTIP